MIFGVVAVVILGLIIIVIHIRLSILEARIKELEK